MLSILDADGIMMALPVPSSSDIHIELGRGAWSTATGRRNVLSTAKYLIAAPPCGAPRRAFFEGMVLGTTTVRTVRHAPCPVLVVQG